MKKLLLLLFLANVASGQSVYYVSPSGNDGNSGMSTSLAWKTIQKAFNSAGAGSTVNIMAGVYYERITANVSGTPTAPITFQNYANGVVIIHGNNQGGTLLDIPSRTNLIIKGLRFQFLAANFAVGLKIQGNSTNIKILNNVFSNIDYGPQTETFDCVNTVRSANPLLLLGNSASSAQNIEIKGNTLEKCKTGCSEALTITGNVDGFTITENTLNQIGNIGIVAAGFYQWVFTTHNPSYNQARNGVISKNIVSNCESPVTGKYSAGIYIDGAKDIVVEKNRSFDNQVGIQVGCENAGYQATGIKVRNNVVYGNERHGLGIGGILETAHGSVANASVYNNTLFQNNLASGSDYGELYIGKLSNSTVKNNLVYAYKHFYAVLMKVQYPSWFASNTFDYNLYYSPNNAENAVFKWGESNLWTFAQYKASTGKESNSLQGNPEFINGTLSTPELHIKPNSAAIAKGDPTVNTSLSGTQDFDDNNRYNSRIDIGAYEYYVCPVNTEVFGSILGNVIFNGTKIEASGPVSGPNNAYNASGSILLQPGFSVRSGSVFRAQITPCN